ncbi:hypothetical protein IFR05_010939 [Cadophora sp. M221]|nr:hypothetical protein IFR05_010939 [Cadophora sp. M221]
MDPLSISASIAGLLSLTGAVTSGVTSLITTYKDANKNLITLCLELGSVGQSIELVKCALGSFSTHAIPSTPEFEALALCRKTLEELSHILLRFEEQKKMVSVPPIVASGPPGKLSIRERFGWVRNASKIKDFVDRIERHMSTIVLYLSAYEIQVLKAGMQKGDNVLSEMRRLERTVKEIKKDMEDTATQSYFGVVNPNKWLWNASERRQNGTGLWFIQGQKFQGWKSGDERMLWVHGIPGAGKTTLAALAIVTARVGAYENMSSLKAVEIAGDVQMEAVAYFFCDYKALPTLDVNTIIASLLLQLGKQCPEAFTKLQSFRAEFERDYGSVTAVPLKLLFATFADVVSLFSTVSVIVDGLDECLEHSSIVQALVPLCGETDTLRMLCFSRDEPDIRRGLMGAGFSEHPVEADNQDIKAYVAAQLEERTKNHLLTVENADLKMKIQERLTCGAKGMFRWVECQLDALCELSYDEAINEALENLPPGILETYEQILTRIRAGKEENFVVRALKWICHSPKPPTVAALSEIVMIQPNKAYEKFGGSFNSHKLLKYCSSLVRYTERDRTVELAHYSVKEYLQQIPDGSAFGTLRMDESLDQNVAPRFVQDEI